MRTPSCGGKRGEKREEDICKKGKEELSGKIVCLKREERNREKREAILREGRVKEKN